MALAHYDAVSDDSSSLNRPFIVPPSSRDIRAMDSVNFLLQRVTQVTINLRSKSKNEMLELRRKLEGELNLVRDWVKMIEGRERKANSGGSRGRVNNGGKVQRAVHSQPLIVSVIENDCQGGVASSGDNEDKEKRTPKANKLYKNSEFLLAKDKFPPSESNKMTTITTKQHRKKQGGNTFSFSNKTLKSCQVLLDRLMKHKHGWVFNTPVDSVSLGLHDYLDIIKHPMDLGTVKSRLDTNWYKSPKEFAEDVRLTFGNAMTYNPKGQDVHIMADQLLKIFEEKWANIESDHMQELRLAAAKNEIGLAISPTSRNKDGPSLVSPPPAELKRTAHGRSESRTNPIDSSVMKATGSGRTAAPKKPKAREPNKRDMTFEEKQKLSSSLQNLPSDKLDDVVKIIKKRNSSLCQDDDEIEVDIDSIDTETLWELDRFITNYKKALSKIKRNAELAFRPRAEEAQPDALPQAHMKIQDPPAVMAELRQTKSDEKDASSQPPVQVAQQQEKESANRSSNASSSSGGGTGSSASDSETECSSGVGSDAGGHSPKTQT